MSKKNKNEWDILVKDLELNDSLQKRTVELVLRTSDACPPRVIRKYIADVLGGYRHWRRGSPDIQYKKWKARELRENVKPEADRLMAKYIADNHKPYIAKEMAAKEISNRFRITVRLAEEIITPRNRRK